MSVVLPKCGAYWRAGFKRGNIQYIKSTITHENFACRQTGIPRAGRGRETRHKVFSLST